MSDSSSCAQILIQPLRAGLRTAEGQVLEVLIRVQAAEHPPAGDEAAPRLPHALALVIDRSGSMQGKPLDEAKRCAEFVVSRLTPTDALALVQFDNRVERLWPAVPLGDGGSVKSAIGRIDAGGTTNLHGGWLHGAESLAAVAGEGLKRVILLSDGCANEGVTETSDIAEQCAQWAARGISTSTYGLGNGRAELQAAAALGDMRELIEKGEWQAVDQLLAEARKRFGDNPWLADVMRSMAELAERRDEARLAKESVFFRSVASSRLTEMNEAIDPVDERLEIPSFLRKKARQGKAERT